MGYEHSARLDEIAASDLTTGWSFQENEYFAALFLDNGPALVVASRLHCGRESWHLEFAANVLEPAWTGPDRDPQGGVQSAPQKLSGRSHAKVVAEAAVVVGPFQDRRSVHKQTVGALSHMRELLLEQIDEALDAPDTIFRPEFAEWMDEELPYSEALLDHLANLGQTIASPVVHDFLKLLASSKRRRLH